MDAQVQQQLREWRKECFARVLEQLERREAVFPAWDESSNRYFFNQKSGESIKLPTEAGVYVFYSHRTHVPVYVGETDNLKRRLGDHCKVSGTSVFKDRWVRSWIGPQVTKEGIIRFIDSKMYIKYLVISFGRCEIENDLRGRWKLDGPTSISPDVF